MAHLEVTGLDEIMKALNKLAEPTKMAIKAVDAAAPVLEESFKESIKSAADRGYATGGLANSVTHTPAKENALGVYSVAKVDGTNSRGLRNVEELAYLEYGTRRKSGKQQAPRPVRQKAINMAQSKCERIIEEQISAAVDEIW
jgi:HK97 gp10 family phage protein